MNINEALNILNLSGSVTKADVKVTNKWHNRQNLER